MIKLSFWVLFSSKENLLQFTTKKLGSFRSPHLMRGTKLNRMATGRGPKNHESILATAKNRCTGDIRLGVSNESGRGEGRGKIHHLQHHHAEERQFVRICLIKWKEYCKAGTGERLVGEQVSKGLSWQAFFFFAAALFTHLCAHLSSLWCGEGAGRGVGGAIRCVALSSRPNRGPFAAGATRKLRKKWKESTKQSKKKHWLVTYDCAILL